MWFTNLYLLFSVQTSCFEENMLGADGTPILDDSNKPMKKIGKIWEYTDGEMWKQWYWAIFYIFISFMLITLIFFIISILLFLNSLSCLFLPLLMVAKVKDSPDNKSYTFSTLLGNILKYKMSVIMYIISYFLITDASSTFGGIGAFVAIIACIFIYAFYPNIYKQYIPTDPTSTIGLVSYKQAQKFCSKVDLDIPKDCNIPHQKSWFEWLFGDDLPSSVSSMAAAEPIAEPVASVSPAEPSAPLAPAIEPVASVAPPEPSAPPAPAIEPVTSET